MNTKIMIAGLTGAVLSVAGLMMLPVSSQTNAQAVEQVSVQQSAAQEQHGQLGMRERGMHLKERGTLFRQYCEDNGEICQEHRAFHQSRREAMFEAKATVLGVSVDELKATVKEKPMIQIITEAGFSAQEFHTQVQSQLAN